MKGFHEARALIRARLDEEIGTIRREAPRRVALVYPSPYHVGDDLARLPGHLRHHRTASRAGPPSAPSCPTTSTPGGARACRSSPTKARRRSAAFRVIAFSVAYELELAGLFDCLALGRAPAARARARRRRIRSSSPAGRSPSRTRCRSAPSSTSWSWARPRSSPAYCSPPSTPSPIAPRCSTRSRDARRLRARRSTASGLPAGRARPTTRSCPRARRSVTPNTELRSMFLIEPERGCSRGCTYCVMRRSTNGGMRIVAPDVVLGADPRGRAPRRASSAPRSATTRKIVEIVHRARRERARGRHLVAARRSAHRRVRGPAGARRLPHAHHRVGRRRASACARSIERKTKEKHLVRAAELARAHGMARLKLYLMVGAARRDATRTSTSWSRFARELSQDHPAGARRRALRGQAQHAARRRALRRHRATSRTSSSGCAGASRARRGAADVARAGRGSSTCSRRAASRPAVARSPRIRAGGSFAAWKRAFADDGARRAAAARRSLTRHDARPPREPATGASRLTRRGGDIRCGGCARSYWR